MHKHEVSFQYLHIFICNEYTKEKMMQRCIPQYNTYSDGDFLWDFPYLLSSLQSRCTAFGDHNNVGVFISEMEFWKKKKTLYTPGCMQLVNCKIGQFTMLMLWLLLQGLSVLPEKLIKGLSRTMVLPSFRQTWVPDGKQDMFAQFPEHRFRYPLCCVKTCQEGHSSMVEWVHSQCHQKSKNKK